MEQEIIREIVDGDEQAILKLQHYYALNGKEYVAGRIATALESYKGDNLKNYVVCYILNACPKCGSMNTEVRNYDEVWRDGDIVCNECETHVRMYDAG